MALTLTLSRRERGLTGLFGRVTPTRKYRVELRFWKAPDRLPFPSSEGGGNDRVDCSVRTGLRSPVELGIRFNEDLPPFPLAPWGEGGGEGVALDLRVQ